MKQQKKTGLLITLLFIFIILAAAIFFLLGTKKDKNEKQHLTLLTERYQLAYNTVMEQYSQLSETLYSGLLKRYGILDIYKKLPNADEEEKDKLRQELFVNISPRYNELKKDVQLRQLHFHLPNNDSFLRLHKPDKFGDNLTSIRKTVAFVNREHSSITGFEEGRIFNGYRFVFPITGDDLPHLGSVEISFGPDAITSAIMKQYYVLSNFFIKDEIAKTKLFPGQQSANYTKSPYKGYSFDNAVLTALREVSRKDLKHLQPKQSMRDTIYAMAHSGQPMSTYDPYTDAAFSTFPVVNPVTGKMNGFLTVRSHSALFKNEEIHFWLEYGLSLIVLFTFLSTYYLQSVKRTALEVKTEELSNSKEQLQRYISAIDESGMGLLIIDDDFKIREMNKTMTSWFGEQQGNFCYSVLPDRETPCPDCRCHEVIHDGIAASYSLTTQQGRSFDIVSAPIKTPGGDISMMEVFRDVSDQKKAEQQLIKAKEEAESANLTKSIFLSNMGHELRTPLNGILGYTQIFAEDSSLSTRQQKGIQIIHQSGEALLMLINDILDISKIESGKMELLPSEFRLPEFLLEIENIIRVRCREKGLLFSSEYGDSLPAAIEADELRLRQVLLNLLSNAVKFTEHGHCTFTIRTQLVDERKVRLLFNISDSGKGIAPEMQEKIFDPFQQTGERLKYSQGSGLGLSISRKLIEIMGGKLEVRSPVNEHPANEEGVGSTFTFIIDVPLGYTTINGQDQQYIRETTTEPQEGEEGVAFPPQERLNTLTTLIRGGYIDAMLDQVEEIAFMDSGKYQAFAQKVMFLAEDFQLDKLETFITGSEKSSFKD